MTKYILWPEIQQYMHYPRCSIFCTTTDSAYMIPESLYNEINNVYNESDSIYNSL